MIEILRGLPASGKTTYAKTRIENDKNIIRINKDCLREMLHFGKYSPENELIVCEVRDWILRMATSEGYSVIVDDTNSKEKHVDAIVSATKKTPFDVAAKVEIKKFNTHIDDCILRDRMRPKSVGEDVIRKIAKDFETADDQSK